MLGFKNFSATQSLLAQSAGRFSLTDIEATPEDQLDFSVMHGSELLPRGEDGEKNNSQLSESTNLKGHHITEILFPQKQKRL